MRLEIEIDTWEMYEPFVTARDTTTHIDTVTAVLPDGELVGRGEALGDTLAECRVEMLEQPLPAGGDDALEGYRYPVSLCADESCQSTAELEAAASRYTMINIKLDKSGGLTEALKMIDWCSGRGIELMVGNMLGSSLTMAPGFVVAQACRFVDLDGPLWQRADRDPPITYDGSIMQAPPQALWA